MAREVAIVPGRALRWATGEAWGRLLAGFVAMAVLARLLGPEIWGFVALAMIPVLLVDTVLVQGGWGEALVQRTTLEPAHSAATFCVLGALGLAGMLVVAAAAPVLAWLLGEPDLVPLVVACSLLIPLRALAVVPTALLRRGLAFDVLAARAFWATALGGGLGIAAAATGAGGWSLVVQHLATATLECILVFRGAAWRPAGIGTFRHWREVNRYGMASAAERLVQAAESALVRAIVGYTVGTVAVGQLVLVRSLLDMFAQILVHPGSRIAHVMGSKLQATPSQLGPLFAHSLRVTSTFGVPAFTGIALLAPGILVLVAGENWRDGAPLLTGMALGAITWPVANVQVAMLRAAGRPDLDLLVSASAAALLVAILAPALAWGVGGIGIAYAMRAWLMVPIRTRLVARVTGLASGRDVVMPILLAALVMAAVLLGVEHTLGTALGTLSLLAMSITGAAVFVVVLCSLDRGALSGFLHSFGLDLQRLLSARAALLRLSRPVAKRRRVRAAPLGTAELTLLQRPHIEMLEHLVERNLLPFWRAVSADPLGCDDLHHDVRGRHLGRRNPRLVTQARCLWFWSRLASSPFAVSADRNHADRLHEALLTRFADERHGGFHWEISAATGAPTITDKALYGHAFALFALSEYARLDGAGGAATQAYDLHELIVSRFNRSADGGWLGCLAADWAMLAPEVGSRTGRAVGEASLDDGLHLLEAMLAYEQASGDRDGLVRLVSLAERLGDVLDAEPDQPACDRSYGHEIALICQLYRAKKRFPLALPDLHAALKRAIAAAEVPPGTGIAAAGPLGGPPTDARRIWWVQADTLLAAVTLGEREVTDRLLRWIVTRQVDWRYGEWHGQVGPRGRVSGLKAGPWRGPYHTGRALLDAHRELSSAGAIG